MNLNTIYSGDALDVLRTLPNCSVDCCITSPPYYGLRNYNVIGQIGLESTPEVYISRLVEIFTEVRRVLSDKGTLWIVIGDSYTSSGRGIGKLNTKGTIPKLYGENQFIKPSGGFKQKRKDLFGVPWMLAFALRDSGWFLRQDIVWHKPNPMPESVTDRCTKAHEYIFLLTKSSKYYFDHKAILEPAAYDGRKTTIRKGSPKYHDNAAGIATQTISKGITERWTQHIGDIPARNRRDVWVVPTRPFKGAHFATYPPALIEPCILAGCPADGVVLDPFFGAGTTGLVAKQLGRNYIGIELNDEYVKMAEERIEG